MKVLGVVPSSTDLKWALLEGTRARPRTIVLPSKSQKFPADACEGHALLSLRRLLLTFLSEQGVERVCILQAGTSKFRGPSTSRLKAEGIIQLVGAEQDIPTDVVSPQSFRAQEKRFEDFTGVSPEQALNGGSEFTPKAWRDAVLIGWWGLEA